MIIGEQDAGRSMKIILKKCRSIAGFFKQCEVENRVLIDKQKQLGILKY